MQEKVHIESEAIGTRLQGIHGDSIEAKDVQPRAQITGYAAGQAGVGQIEGEVAGNAQRRIATQARTGEKACAQGRVKQGIAREGGKKVSKLGRVGLVVAMEDCEGRARRLTRQIEGDLMGAPQAVVGGILVDFHFIAKAKGCTGAVGDLRGPVWTDVIDDRPCLDPRPNIFGGRKTG